MNRKYFILPFVALLSLASCSTKNSGEEIPAQTGNRVAAVFSASITKASNALWDNGDAIGIYMKKSGAELAATSILEQVNNTKYVTEAADGAFQPAKGEYVIYFPVDGSDVDFVAYYPYVKPVSEFKIPINLSNQSSQQAIDIMYSDNVTGKNKENPTSQLNFTHRLTKVVVKLANGNGVVATELSGAKVSIDNQLLAGEMSLVDGTVVATTTEASTVDMLSGEGVFESILLPQGGMEGRQVNIDLSNGIHFDFTIPADKTFEAGKKTIYNVTLTRVDIDVTATITDWTVQGEENGDAIAQTE